MVTREFRILLSDPQATKVLSFVHPPRGVRSVVVRNIVYPYYLPATGESGELLVKCRIPGLPEVLTSPHILVTDDGAINYTSACSFTNGFLFATFSHTWEHIQSLKIEHPGLMTQLQIDIQYVATDGGGRVFLPIIPNCQITVEIEVSADSW